MKQLVTMAMPPTEIRYKKSMAYFILIVAGFLLLTLPVSLLYSPATKAAPTTYNTSIAITIVLVVVSWRLYKRATSGEPVLVLTSEGIHIPAKNNLFIPWDDITKWTIRRYKSSYTLIIYSSGGKTRIAISWLDQPVQEIERLMNSYIRKPGPHI